MTTRAAIFAAVVLSGAMLPAAPTVPNQTSAIGPQVGATVPAFTGVDQFGRSQSLASILRPKGAMLVFFRSADW